MSPTKYNPQDLAKVIQWANANKVEYGDEKEIVFEQKKTSFIEEKVKLRNMNGIILTSLNMGTSGRTNKGKYKCKSADDNSLIPAYI